MSGREQAAAVSLLLAAAEMLRDPLAKPAERERVAAQIALFIDHKEVTIAPPQQKWPR